MSELLREVFAWPEGWPFLLCVPLLWWAARRAQHVRQATLPRVAGARGERVAARADHRGLPVLLALGALAAVIALLRPRFGEGHDAARPRGADLMLCLDVSRSMLARDLEPDRLEFARHELRALGDRAQGDRLGLLLFAGEARLAVPLTADLASWRAMVDLADPLSVRVGGSDLAAALRAAGDALDASQGDHAAIVLLTDADDPAGKAAAVAAALRERGIDVHCLGLGSSEGSKVTIEVDGVQQFLRDASGAEVISRLDEPALTRVVEAGGGMFLAAIGRERPLLTIYERAIERAARQVHAATARRERPLRIEAPLSIAVLCFALALLRSWRRAG